MTDRIANDPWAERRRLRRAKNWWAVLLLPAWFFVFTGMMLVTESEAVLSWVALTFLGVWGFFYLGALGRFAGSSCPRCGSAFGQGSSIPFVRGRCRSCGLREGAGFTLVKYYPATRSREDAT